MYLFHIISYKLVSIYMAIKFDMQDRLGMLLICDDEWRYIMDEWLNDEITITNFRQSSWFPCSYCHNIVMLTTKAVIIS
jgi:hypothetical protein